MSTAAQQNASRQNGAHSNGPVTAEGKARAARNSTKHGLTGGSAVLPNESQREYDAFKKSYIELWQPNSPAEQGMVEQMVAAAWRLRRVEQMEAAILNAAFEREMEALGEQGDRNLAMARAYAEVTENSKGWRSLDRHQRTLQRGYEQALKALTVLQEQTQKQLFEKVQEHIEAIKEPIVQNEPGITASVNSESDPDPKPTPIRGERRHGYLDSLAA